MSRFWRVLLVIGVVAFGIRGTYVAVAKSGPCPIEFLGETMTVIESDCTRGDELYYNAAANHLADGGGFTEAPIFLFGRDDAVAGPAADHPPALVVVLGAVSWLSKAPPLEWIGDESHVAQHRWTMVIIGVGLVLCIGVLGREVGRSLRWRRPDELGWVAAGLAAVYPFVWVADGLIFAEPIASVLVVLALTVALRMLIHPTLRAAALLGAIIGLASLARAELAMLALVLVPVVVVRGFGGARRWRALVASTATALVVVAPWIGFNLARFSEPVLLSTNIGLAMRGSSCDPAFYGPATGLTILDERCVVDPTPPGEEWDQSQISDAWQDEALSYVRDHLERAPIVAAARIGRTWSMFRPVDAIRVNEGEGREGWATRLGLLAFYPVLALAVAGVLVAAQRDRMVAWVLLVAPIVVTVASVITYGQVRFRGPAEPAIVVLASVALTLLAGRFARRDVDLVAITPDR